MNDHVAHIPVGQHHERRPLGGHRYTSRDFAEAEWDNVWTKTWLLLGRADDITEAGDFFTEDVGRESILVARQEDGGIKAFYNVCQHRGNLLMADGEGSVPAFTCAYHGWKYALDGSCTHVQDLEDFAENPCPKAHLVEVACDQFAGFVWINMDSDCVPLRDFMGELWEGWASYPLEDMTRTQAISVRLPCKWKMIMDNFHEVYHLAVSHPDAILFADDDYRQVRLDLYENGHALGANFGAYPAKRILESGIDRMTDILVNELRQWGLDPEDFRGREDEARGAIQQAKRVEGPRRGLRHYDALSDAQLTDTFHYTVFPNFATSLNPDGMLFLRALPDAKDPEKCVFDCWYYAYGDGKGQNAFGALVTAGEGAAGVEREWVEYGEKSLGVVLDGDVDVMAGQQKAMHSAGYRGSLHAGQEKRVAQYHNMIDAYIAGYRPAPRAARDRRSASASP